MTEEMREGGCACGALRYRVHGAPMVVHACHCTDCQTETGAAFAFNAVYEAARVERLAGEIEPVAVPSASGEGQTIVRCPICHVAVWSHYAGAGRRSCFIRAGTLDDSAGIEPDAHIYTRSKVQWLILPESVPAFDGFYRPAEVWTDAARARWEGMMAEPEPAAD